MSAYISRLLETILDTNPDISYLSDVRVHHLPTTAKPLGVHGIGVYLPFFSESMFIVCDYDLTHLIYLMTHELDHMDFRKKNGFFKMLFTAFSPFKFRIENSAVERSLSTLQKLRERYPKIKEGYDKLIEGVKYSQYSRNPIRRIQHLVYFRNLKLE